MDAKLPARLRGVQLLLSVVACLAVGWSGPSYARRIAVDFAGQNPDEISPNGDIWVPDSTSCGINDTAPASCGITYVNNSTTAIKLPFSIRIGDPPTSSDPPPLYDTIYINRRGFVTFGSAAPFAPSFSTGADLATLRQIISENGTVTRPFLAPFYQDLDVPDRIAGDFAPSPFNGGGGAYFRATADPVEPAVFAEALPAFAVTWIQPDNDFNEPSDDGVDTSILTQLVIYSTSADGDWQLRFRYGDGTSADPFTPPYNQAGTVVPGLAGFSLETGLPADALTISDTVTVTAELSTRDDVDYFFTFEDGHLVTGAPTDTDGDGIPDSTDNCPNLANTGQADADGDGTGDACDTDDDNDGVVDPSDNCPLTANPGQGNNDGDAQGDACDTDDDNDGVADTSDNCPLAANPGQADSDGDGIGDTCDSTPLPPLRCDADADRDIDARDLEAILRALGRNATGPTDPRDFDGNLKIRLNDLLNCTKRCTRKFCAVR